MNTTESIKMGKSRSLGARCNYYILHILNEQEDGSMSISLLKERMSNIMDLDEWAMYVYPNSLNQRWNVIMQYYSVDLVKSEFLTKNNGIWSITSSGRDAIKKYNNEPHKLFALTHKLYNEWRKRNKLSADDPYYDSKDENIADKIPEFIKHNDIIQMASDGIREHISNKSPFEFQDMVAALLRAMGYYTPFVAPKGKDGGIDIIAYSDPLGATRTTLKVQVKHYDINNPVTVDVVRNIIGVAKGDIPIIVTSGRFAESAKIEARQNNVRLIDGSEFIELWIECYENLSEQDKSLMRIEPIYFIVNNEI